MIAPESIRAIALSAVVAGAMGAFLWWDAAHVQERHSVSRVPMPAADSAPPATAPAASTIGIPGSQPSRPAGPYRCEVNGRTLYQADSCPKGAIQTELARGTVSVVDPPSPSMQLARIEALGRAAEVQSETAFGIIEAQPVDKPRARCTWLVKAIERVDARARERNTSQTMEWLRAERRGYVEEINHLGCSRMSASR